MDASKTARRVLLPVIVVVLAVGYLAVGRGGWASAPVTTGQAPAVRGMESMSGTVTSAKPFKAAQVYIRNVDMRIMYMVFTNAGQFRAVSLFPGNYEVSVTAKGFKSGVQKLAVKAGDNPKVNLSLQEVASSNQAEANPLQNLETLASSRVNVSFDIYDNIYPPGPGRDVAERTCIICHGENFLPSQPGSAAVWNARVDRMMGKANFDRAANSYAEGLLSYRAQQFRFSRQDREDLVAYMVKNFGPGAPPRNVRTVQETPLDEAKLGKAMFMEYYVPQDAPGQGVNAPEYARPGGGAGTRRIQDVRFDADGNVYGSDRGTPRRLIKLNPRTGEWREWVTPHPKSDVHEVLISPDGMIWMPEHAEGGVRSYLLGFNPKTEKWDVNVDGDPTDVVRNGIKWMQSQAFDSKLNLYMGWIMGGALAKYERETGKVTVFPMPSTNAIPYGIVADRNDNLWIADWGSGKIMRFDTHTNTWIEFTPPTYPGQTRRPNVDYQNNIWWAIWFAPRGSRDAPALSVLYPDMDKITTFGAFYVNGPPGYPFKVTNSTAKTSQ